MSFIKFVVKRLSDNEGNTITTTISRMESDLSSVSNNELYLIMHAMSAKGKVEIDSDFILDSGRLDSDYLG